MVKAKLVQDRWFNPKCCNGFIFPTFKTHLGICTKESKSRRCQIPYLKAYAIPNYQILHYLSKLHRRILQKLTATSLLTQFPVFHGTYNSQPYSQEPALYHFTSNFCEIQCNNILTSESYVSQVVFYLQVLVLILCVHHCYKCYTAGLHTTFLYFVCHSMFSWIMSILGCAPKISGCKSMSPSFCSSTVLMFSTQACCTLLYLGGYISVLGITAAAERLLLDPETLKKINLH